MLVPNCLRSASIFSSTANPSWARLPGAREMKSNAITARDIELFGRREDRLFRLLQSKPGILRAVRFQTNGAAHLQKPLTNADNSILVCVCLSARGRDEASREESPAAAL